MAQIIEIPAFGNQTLIVPFQGVQFDFDFAWNGRNQRYTAQITDATNQVILQAQSIEPFSTLGLYGIDINGFSLMPFLDSPTYLDTGEISYAFEDLGDALQLGFFTADELALIDPPVTNL